MANRLLADCRTVCEFFSKVPVDAISDYGCIMESEGELLSERRPPIETVAGHIKTYSNSLVGVSRRKNL